MPASDSGTRKNRDPPNCPLALLPLATWSVTSQPKAPIPQCLPLFYWSRKKANWTGGSIAKLSMSISSTVIQNICKQGTERVLGQDCQRDGLCTV